MTSQIALRSIVEYLDELLEISKYDEGPANGLMIGMNLIVGSHYMTELHGVQALTDHVAKRFELPWEFIPEDSGLG